MKSHNQFYTYVYYTPDTMTPFFVGKGSGKRSHSHLTEEHHETKNFHKWAKISSIKKQGKEPVIKIFYTHSEQAAYELEEFLTHHWGLESEGGILTNMIHGGTGGWKGVAKSEDHKRKIGEANRLRSLTDPESNARRSKSLIGNQNGKGLIGFKRSEESKQRMSEAQKKKFADNPESHPWIGRQHTEETKEKQSLAKLGKKQPIEGVRKSAASRTGLTRTEETKSKMSDSASATWQITYPDGKKEVIKNLRQFCKEHNISDGNLISLGKTKGYSAVKIVHTWCQ